MQTALASVGIAGLSREGGGGGGGNLIRHDVVAASGIFSLLGGNVRAPAKSSPVKRLRAILMRERTSTFLLQPAVKVNSGRIIVFQGNNGGVLGHTGHGAARPADAFSCRNADCFRTSYFLLFVFSNWKTWRAWTGFSVLPGEMNFNFHRETLPRRI